MADHIDRDRFNNLGNLRLATVSQQPMNKTGVKGVFPNNTGYFARIQRNLRR